MPCPIKICMALALVSLAGCAPELGSDHPGWRQADCFGANCHARSETHHNDRDPYQCAECHGRNGAPGGHAGSAPCGECHPDFHGGLVRGFVDPAACQTCHP
jgi:hypothetical protein